MGGIKNNAQGARKNQEKGYTCILKAQISPGEELRDTVPSLCTLTCLPNMLAATNFAA